MNERAVALASLVPTTLLPRLRGRGAAPAPWPEPCAGETLSVRVGVSCGDVWTARVGGIEGRWEYLAAGAPVAEMGAAAAAAKPGQVALAPSAAALVSDRVHGALGQDGVLVATSVNA